MNNWEAPVPDGNHFGNALVAVLIDDDDLDALEGLLFQTVE
jgi:hypothetical protein